MICIENDASNNSSIVACIRYHGNVFTEPFPSNDRGIHIQTHRLIGGIYEVHQADGLRCHDIHKNFSEVWFMHSEVDRKYTHIDTQTAW
jgi:hypothetical protein